MNEKLKIKSKILILLGIIFLFILLPVYFTCTSSYTVLIHEKKPVYYHGKYMHLLGNRIFVLKGDKEFKSRIKALRYKEHDYSFSILSMKDITRIEIIPKEEDEIESAVASKYLGTYKINATGHIGYLYLRSHKGKLYGTLRFPNWGKGAHEYAKGLRIQNGRISFIRSVTTAKEMRRVGANSYFTQRYFGTYSNSGRTIKGYFFKNNSKFMWEGDR